MWPTRSESGGYWVGGEKIPRRMDTQRRDLIFIG
jgi:hypothetical protein